MIYADKQMLRAYDWAKRNLGLSDQTASKILGYRDRLRRKVPRAPNGRPHHCCTLGDASDLGVTPAVPGHKPVRSPAELSRRRFTISMVIAIAAMGVPFLPPLGPVVRRAHSAPRGPYDNFYDLQARAMFHGHLDLPEGQMGIEAFGHDGPPTPISGSSLDHPNADPAPHQ